MCAIVPNFIKISQTFAKMQRYGNLTVFKMAAVRHLGFVKFEFLNGWSGEGTYFALAYEIL